MSELTEERIGYGFGLLGGLLFLAGALVAAFAGVFFAVTGHPYGTLGAWSAALVLTVLGLVAMFFAYVGHRNWSGHTAVAGVLLLVVALLGWAVSGFGVNVLALIGDIFVLFAGLLYLVQPAVRASRAVVGA
jgi:hypothetical protein